MCQSERRNDMFITKDGKASPIPEGMTNEDFKRLLCEILQNWRAEDLIDSVPGIYELAGNHFKEDVIELWQESRAAA
jgi:hypothetical protein